MGKMNIHLFPNFSWFLIAIVFCMFPVNGMETTKEKSQLPSFSKQKKIQNKKDRVSFGTAFAKSEQGEIETVSLLSPDESSPQKKGINAQHIRNQINTLLDSLDPKCSKKELWDNSLQEIVDAIQNGEDVYILKSKINLLQTRYTFSVEEKERIEDLFTLLPRLKTFTAQSHAVEAPDLYSVSCKKWCTACKLEKNDLCQIASILDQLQSLILYIGNSQNLPEQLSKLLIKLDKYSLEDLKDRINNINESLKNVPMKMVYKNSLEAAREISELLAVLMNELWAVHKNDE